MLKSLWIKFIILLLAVSFVAVSAAFVLKSLMINDFQKYTEGQLEDRVYWVIADLEGTYEKYGGWNEDVIAEDAIWALMLGFEIKVISGDAKLVMDTDKALGHLSPLLRKRVTAISRFGKIERADHFLPYPLFLAGKEFSRLEVGFLKPEREDIFVKRANWFLLFSLLGMGGLALILSVIFSRKLTRPLTKLSSAAEGIIEGNLKSRLDVAGHDEIARLSATFNRLTRFLATQESLRKKLISNIVHEIRTPLGAMRGELAGMVDGFIPCDKEQLNSVYEETWRLENILEGIEEFSRAQAGALFIHKKTAKIKPIFLNIKNTFGKVFLDKGVSLDVQCSDDMEAFADTSKLSQIIVNLVSNALKATDKGGSIWIRAHKNGNETIIEIEDTGHGIKSDDLPFIFERFYRSSEGGLGIGLAIVKELVDAHEGRIAVKSECGKGTVFTLYLPERES